MSQGPNKPDDPGPEPATNHKHGRSRRFRTTLGGWPPAEHTPPGATAVPSRSDRGDFESGEFETQETRELNVQAQDPALFDTMPLPVDSDSLLGDDLLANDVPADDWPVEPDAIERRLVEEIAAHAPPRETPSEKLRRTVSGLMDLAQSHYIDGRLDVAVSALELVWAEDPDSVITQKAIQQHLDTVCSIYESYVGDPASVPVVASMSQLSGAHIDNRAMFLLSRIDGLMTVDELLDVAGMPRIDALRYLSALISQGLVRVT